MLKTIKYNIIFLGLLSFSIQAEMYCQALKCGVIGEANENQNTTVSSGSSTSNIFCIQNDPLVFIPNAISLGGAVNYWKPVINMISLSEYSVSIFNRHGELIFYTEDVNQPWDGSISGSTNNTSMGVYIYQVEFKNSEGRYFLKKGHINLIP